MKPYALFIIGGHYGDEAKGKIADILAPKFDAVVRGSGGANAGHTIIAGEKKIALHLLPVGVLHQGPLNVLGAEMVIDPLAMEKELSEASEWNANPRLMVAKQANLVMDWHKHFDAASEKGSTQIGTTKRGIGPCAEAKYSRRWALQVRDLFSPNIRAKMRGLLLEQAPRLIENHPDFKECEDLSLSSIRQSSIFLDKLDAYVDAQLQLLAPITERLRPLVSDDVGAQLVTCKRILGEGAQGTMLDPTFGLLPFTTSTPTTTQGITRGMMLEVADRDVLCVFKAYETRVGEGPFPTQMEGELAERVQKKGGEFGATTGRPRRCGWFNLSEAHLAMRVNGMTWMAITKLDVLDELDTIKVGTEKNHAIEYASFPGWKQSTVTCRKREELPANAQRFLAWLEEQLVPIAFISVGPERSQTIITDAFRKRMSEKGVTL